jgi:hypothetical protein
MISNAENYGNYDVLGVEVDLNSIKQSEWRKTH